MSLRRGLTYVIAAALAASVGGCGGATSRSVLGDGAGGADGPGGSAGPTRASAGTADSGGATATPAGPRTPLAGPWHEGATMPVSSRSLPSTVTFTGSDGPPVVVVGHNTTAFAGGGRPAQLRLHRGYSVVGAPVFDASGRGVVVMSGPSQSQPGYDPLARLVWATIDRRGETGPTHTLAAHAQYAQFASDGAGNAIVAWVDFDPSLGERDPLRTTMRTAVRPRGGSFGPTTTLTKLPGGVYYGNYLPFGPQITASIGHGRTVVATKDPTTSTYGSRIRAWTGTVDGNFDARAIEVPRTAVTITSAISTKGRAFLAWGTQVSGEEADSPWTVSATSIAAGARDAEPVQQIDRGAKAFPIAPPVLADDRRGGVILAWSGLENRAVPVPVRARKGRVDGTFGPTQTLARKGAVEGVVVGPDGTAILTWADVHPTGEPSGLVASVRAPGDGQFAPAERVPVGTPGVAPTPAFDADGRPTVVYATRAPRGAILHLLARDRP